MSVPTQGSAPDHARIVIVLALVVAIAAGVLVVLGERKLSRDADAADHPSIGTAAAADGAKTALTEGAQLAVDFTSINYKTIDQDRINSAQHFTASYRKAYLVQSKGLAAGIKKFKVVAVSKVAAIGLQDYNAAAGTATVLVAVDITTTNIKSTAGTLSYYRFSVPLERDGDQWLASNMQPV